MKGTTKERGIDAWQVKDGEPDVDGEYDVYAPLIPRKWTQWPAWKYTPFMPSPRCPTMDSHSPSETGITQQVYGLRSH